MHVFDKNRKKMTPQNNVILAETLALAEMIHKLERRRNDGFHIHSLVNTAWLVYLSLFIAHAGGASDTTRSLQSTNGLDTYDAIHGVEQLVAAGLAVREYSPMVSLDTPVRLTQIGLEKLNRFLAANLDDAEMLIEMDQFR